MLNLCQHAVAAVTLNMFQHAAAITLNLFQHVAAITLTLFQHTPAVMPNLFQHLTFQTLSLLNTLPAAENPNLRPGRATPGWSPLHD